MFANTKIRIKSPEHSKLVQEALFKAGFKWGAGRGIKLTGKPFLFIYEKDITYSDEERHFNSHEHKEIFYPPKIKTIKD